MSEVQTLTEHRERPAASPGMDFESFYLAHRLRLFRALVVVTRDVLAAEELTQDAFARVWERWDRVRTIDDPIGYLFRTALNGWFQIRRRAVRAAKRSLMPRDSVDPLETVESRDLLARRLLELPVRQRAALILTEYLGYDSAEAGRSLGIRPGTVRRLTSKARGRLRASYEEGES
jgi:RNA polymerase sigma-70 factor (ECF subfamily)